MIRVSDADRLTALRVGANVLHDCVRPITAPIMVQQYMNRYNAEAAWLWPGVVTVAMRASRSRIVQSCLGQPSLVNDAIQACEEPGLWFTVAERQAALAVACRALIVQEQRPARRVFVFHGLAAVATWCWPGVVSLRARDTGELIAQSLPGRPVDMDAEAIASEATQ